MNPLVGLAVVAGLAFVAAGGASPKDPDFARVTSKEMAQELAARGELVRVFLFPTELGGPDVPENVIYISPQAVKGRDSIIDTLDRMVGDGLIERMNVRPEYTGRSIVPNRITFHATGKKNGGYEATLFVW